MGNKISDNLKKKFDTANRICVLTGAGISAESGIPTFRGGGESAVWKGMPFEQISSARMVREDLDAVWEWFDYRRGLYKDCQPNPAHIALAEWQNRFEDFTLVTQNVDGFHERAGSRDVIELHGNVNHAKCENCGKVYPNESRRRAAQTYALRRLRNKIASGCGFVRRNVASRCI